MKLRKTGKLPLILWRRARTGDTCLRTVHTGPRWRFALKARFLAANAQFGAAPRNKRETCRRPPTRAPSPLERWSRNTLCSPSPSWPDAGTLGNKGGSLGTKRVGKSPPPPDNHPATHRPNRNLFGTPCATEALQGTRNRQHSFLNRRGRKSHASERRKNRKRQQQQQRREVGRVSHKARPHVFEEQNANP